MSGIVSTIVKALPLGGEHLARAKAYAKGGAVFGAGGAILGCYLLEWKAILRFLPYYNGKYKD